jgi:hypothetical protein
MDEHYSLLRKFVNCRQKKFYNIDPWLCDREAQEIKNIAPGQIKISGFEKVTVAITS